MAKEPSIPHGVYGAALAPFKADLSCNCEELNAHCFDLLDRGCVGVALFGTTGEGPSFSLKERKEILERLISDGLDPKKIILANICTSISDTVEFTQAALKHGCSTLLIAPPSFYKNVSDEGVIAFYREIITQVANPNLKVILYHIPQNTGVPITLNVIETLCKEFPDIVVGLKESEGNLLFAKAVIDRFPNLEVFIANEKQIIEGVNYGAAGSICGISNLYPELIVSLYEQGKQAIVQNPKEIEDVFLALKGYPFIPAAKAVMEMRNGANWKMVRPPLAPLNAEQSTAFISKLQEFELEDKIFQK